MSKITNTVICLASTAAFVLAIVAFPSFVFAQQSPPNDVNFETNPLFDVGDFLPGDQVTKTVTVTNNSETNQTVQAAAGDVLDNDGLGEKLELTISTASGKQIYSDTLDSFFANGVELSDIASDEKTTYIFSVYFEESTGNAYQGKTLGFDLCVGFVGGELSCSDVSEDTNTQDITAETAGVGGAGLAATAQDTGGEERRTKEKSDEGIADQEVAGAATSSSVESSLSGPLADLKEALRDLKLSLQSEGVQSEPVVAGTSATTSPGLPNTGTGSDVGTAVIALSLLLLTLAAALRASKRFYKVFSS